VLLLNDYLLLFISLSTLSGNFWIHPCSSELFVLMCLTVTNNPCSWIDVKHKLYMYAFLGAFRTAFVSFDVPVCPSASYSGTQCCRVFVFLLLLILISLRPLESLSFKYLFSFYPTNVYM